MHLLFTYLVASVRLCAMPALSSAPLTRTALARIIDHTLLRPEATTEQIAELCLKFFWWSTNRVDVTLGGDAPHDPERLTSFHYTELGEYVPHSPPVARAAPR